MTLDIRKEASDILSGYREQDLSTDEEVDAIESLCRKVEEEALNGAASLRPPRSKMKRKPGDWYECGWNDGVCFYAEEILSLKSRNERSEKA